MTLYHQNRLLSRKNKDRRRLTVFKLTKKTNYDNIALNEKSWHKGEIMQLLIRLKNDLIKLPIATGETVQGLIYKALREDSRYSDLVHNNGKLSDGRKFKLFTFGELKGRYTVEGRYISYFSSVELEVRSADDYIIQLLFSHFTNNKQLRLGNNDVEVEKLRLLNDSVFSNELHIKTLSPITVYLTEPDGHTKYFSPHDDEFYDMICTNARRKWISCYGTDEGFSFSVSPAEENQRYVKRATKFKDTFISAWHGEFIIKGAPKVLDFLYNVGLGSKNSQGFGMFNILK